MSISGICERSVMLCLKPGAGCLVHTSIAQCRASELVIGRS